MPGSHAWKPLQDGHELNFGDYGDWPSVLMSQAGKDRLMWVLCLEDVVQPEMVSTADADTLLLPLLQPLRTYLTKASAPVLVAWSAWRAENPISNARQPSGWRGLARVLEDALLDLAHKYPVLHLLDLDQLFAPVGLSACYDLRNYYFAHGRFSMKATQLLAETGASIFARASGKAAAKVLALDCDNTLWGGVVGEVGVSGLTLGQDGMGTVFTDFQKEIRRLASEGVVLVLLSKNNEPEVWEVFDQHSAMVLKRTHITASRINWDEKADNLKAIANELDLGLDSFVFWDDNPLEREKVRMHLPQVITPEVPQDVSLWPRMLAGLEAFARFTVTDEDRKKGDQYRSRAAFVNEQKSAGDEVAFLRSIELRPSALPINGTLLPRAAQMCAKTNQFNLRTVRHDEDALTRLAKQAGEGAFVTHLQDRFGDHGNIGLIISAPTTEKDTAFLDTFLISCRVLGRHLEAWMLDTLVQRLKRQGVRWLVAEFIPTGRNVIAETFLANHGLKPFADLPPEQQKRLSTAIVGIANPTGTLFAADLQSLTIPYMDAFTDDQALAAKSA